MIRQRQQQITVAGAPKQPSDEKDLPSHESTSDIEGLPITRPDSPKLLWKPSHVTTVIYDLHRLKGLHMACLIVGHLPGLAVCFIDKDLDVAKCKDMTQEVGDWVTWVLLVFCTYFVLRYLQRGHLLSKLLAFCGLVDGASIAVLAVWPYFKRMVAGI
ncbi:hypothetical protein SAMD00023353_5200550 [Rosellinia necatrix]|uniref:Uncharacterized protein n=1 Tax=Rosellinia necatrix TaxID=77044 RepID=A0A1S8AA91_ROSNE|nr:hypothetical protein SAMD00023353_5200550 [Rosellinia necatrix]